MFDSFSDKQMIQIFGLIAFLSVFLALFVYFAVFPVNTKVVESKTTLGVDPIAFESAKIWNNLNQNTNSIGIDSCNKATRVSEFVWQVELKGC